MDIPEPLAASIELDLANARASSRGQQGGRKAPVPNGASAVTPQLPGSVPGVVSQGMAGASSCLVPSPNLPAHHSIAPASGSTDPLNANIESHVFLLVKRLSDYKVSQWRVDPGSDDESFQSLKAEYIKQRGLIRYWLSIHRFSHCDFRRVSFLYIAANGTNWHR